MVTLVRSALALLWSNCFFFSSFYVLFFTYRHYLLGYRFPMYVTKENEGNAKKYRKRNIKLIKELQMI